LILKEKGMRVGRRERGECMNKEREKRCRTEERINRDYKR
jgi:hypothetical protein